MKKMIASTLLICITLVIGNAAPQLTVRKNEQVPNQNIALETSMQTLGSYTVETQNRVIARRIIFGVATYSVSDTENIDEITQVVLVNQDNQVIAEPVDAVISKDTEGVGILTFTDSVVFPRGTTTITIKGRIGRQFPNMHRFVTVATPPWWMLFDQESDSEFTSSQTLVWGQIMTVRGPALKVAFSPGEGPVVAGLRGVFFGEYRLDATESSEDIRVPGIPGHYEHDTVHGEYATDITGITHWDGSVPLTTGSNMLNPVKPGGQQITYDGTGLIVPKGTIKTITQKVNIRAGITGSYLWSLPEGYAKQFASHTVGLNSAMTAQVTVQPFTGAYKLNVVPHGEVAITREYTKAISENGDGADDFIVLGIRPSYENFQGDLLSILVKVEPTPGFSRGSGLSTPRLVSRDGEVDMTSVLVPLTWQEATFYTATFILRGVSFSQDIKTEFKFKMGYDNALDTGHEVRSWLLGEPKFIGTTSGVRVTQSLPNESDGQTVIIRRVPEHPVGDANGDGAIDADDKPVLALVAEKMRWKPLPEMEAESETFRRLNTFPDNTIDEWDVAALDAYLKGLFLTLPVGDVSYDWRLTTLDIALARQGILGLRTLQNIQIRQADLNSSDGLSTIDLALMRRLILGLGYSR